MRPALDPHRRQDAGQLITRLGIHSPSFIAINSAPNDQEAMVVLRPATGQPPGYFGCFCIAARGAPTFKNVLNSAIADIATQPVLGAERTG